MSLSDLFNISATVRRDKARQQDLLPVASSSSSSASARLCNICYAKPATYNCPRCNVPFCSTVCFRRREHQECSNAFSSSAISLAQPHKVEVDEADRRKVVDILGRLERDERAARQVQLDKAEEEEEEEDDVDDDDDDEDAESRENITAENIEGASTDALLAMLTPKQRQKFLDAIKHPQKAKLLLGQLDRKAERRAKQQSSQSQQGVLLAPQPSSDTLAPRTSVPREWQTQPWFETPDTSFKSRGTLTERSSSFIASLEAILLAPRTSSKRKESAPVDLMYNLCAVLMAYAYTLRHLDVVSLSERSDSAASQHHTIPKPTQVSSVSEQVDDDDEEPPPLEPDSPTSTIPDPAPMAAPTPAAPTSACDPAIAEQAYEKLNQLVPFLFRWPPPDKPNKAAATTDHSKLLLTSLDDASMWLLSRMSLESEVGAGGADALQLQLLQDLAKLLTLERMVPSFTEGDVDPKYRLASKLASVSPQQAFVAAQTPLLLNAIADLFFFFEHLSVSGSTSSSSPSPTRTRPVSTQFAQRKLCFYLCSVVNADQLSAQSTPSAIHSELQDRIQALRHRIDAANQADKVAAAVNLFTADNDQKGVATGIEEAS